MPNWTDEQKQVIVSRGQNLLVSAAAGSGKTAVIVGRIMEKVLDPESPVDIDRMLVVTFTNAAAASLREKIRVRLEEETAGADKRRAEEAMRQLSMLSSDHIETIDRFCREIVLDHADALEIDPSFRIADEGELQLLQSETVSEVIEESFDDPDEEWRRAFLDFSRLYAPGKTDKGLEDLILSFYRFSMSHEFPKKWRHDCASLYRGDSGSAEWMRYLEESVIMRLREIHDRLEEGLGICGMESGPYHYAAAMAEHEALLDRLIHCGSISDIGDELRCFTWPRPGVKKRKKDAPSVDETLETLVKSIRDQAKKELENLVKLYFFAPDEQMERMRCDTAGYMDVLVSLTDRFEERFSDAKSSRRIADFSDVAHWALSVLIEVDGDGMPVLDEDGSYIRTRIANEYEEYFQEIYIDEYQDSNRVQEILLRSIARPGGRFMVGDMKQSIYRFRMADTGIFLEKERSYSPDPEAKERRVGLHRNFRSRPEVLDAVNLIFRQVMRSETGGVEYTQEQELRPGYDYPEGDAGVKTGSFSRDMTPELVIVQKSDVPGASTSAEAEAAIVARRIRSMAGRMNIYDKEKNVYRPVRYDDITILLRTASGWAETFSRVLDEYGIPNRPDANTGYFDAVEVRTVLAYLHVLDNPRQDIPLAASLRSIIGGLSDTDLAVIRAQMGKGSLYDCVRQYADTGDDPDIRRRLSGFLGMTKKLRALVKDTPIHLLLWEIFDRTGYEERICAMEGGRQKMANLELLADMAMSYEETSYRGLFHFIRYIEKLRKAQRDVGQASDNGGGNLVRIMTMHKSKGLEFPVVFVSGLCKRFNLQDSRGALAMHEHLGAGLDYRDKNRMYRMRSRIRSAIAERIRTDSIGEELRVLYVAMTRAEQKLILTGCSDSRGRIIRKALERRMDRGMKIQAGAVAGASCMMDWILAALSRHNAERDYFDSGRWEGPELREDEASFLPGMFRIVEGQDVSGQQDAVSEEDERRLDELFSQDPGRISDPALHSRLEFMLSEQYPFSEGRSHMPLKLSVSEIKHEAYERELRRLSLEEGGRQLNGEESEDAGPGGVCVPTPRFLSGDVSDGTVSGASAGSAYHLVLAELDFVHDLTEGHIQARLETMLKCDKIQKEEAAAVQTGKIARFLDSDLAGRMRRAAMAGKLLREQPFVISQDAADINPEWSGEEQILLQGIIDAFFFEDDHLILVDYKTDRARPGDEESLVRRYRVQFQLYAGALERMLELPVQEAWLYSLSLQKAIRVE